MGIQFVFNVNAESILNCARGGTRRGNQEECRSARSLTQVVADIRG